MKNAALSGKPYAGNPHVRFDEGEVASAKPRRGSLLYMALAITVGMLVGVASAENYIVTTDTSIDDGATLKVGSGAGEWNYNGLKFMASAWFGNPIDVNGTAFTIDSGVDGQVAVVGSGISNTGDFSYTAPTLTFAGTGLTIVSNGISKVSPQFTNNRTILINGGTHNWGYTRVRYNSTKLVCSDATINLHDSDKSEMFVGAGGTFPTVVMSNCTFNTKNQSVDFIHGTWTQYKGSFGTGGGGRGNLFVGGRADWSEGNGSATYNLEGSGATFQTQASLQVGGQCGSGTHGKGCFNVKGGTMTLDSGTHYVAMSSGAYGEINVMGGTYQIKRWGSSANSVTSYIGYSGTGVLNVVSGKMILTGTKAAAKSIMKVGNLASANGTVNLKGGTFEMNDYSEVNGGAGESHFVFNGGTLVPSATMSFPTTAFSELAVGNGGGKVKIGADKTLTFAQPLTAADDEVETDGFFELTDAGTVKLAAGANTYTAPTLVSKGTLDLTDGAPSASTLSVASGATVDFASKAQTIGGVGTLAGTLANLTDLTFAGETQPGGAGAVGTTTLNCSSLTFAAGAKLVIDCDDTTCDKLVVNTVSGAIDLSHLTIEVKGWEGKDRIGPVMEAPNGLTGLPTVSRNCKLRAAFVENGKLYLAKPGLALIVK